jgi:hypothetical protein
MAYDCGDPTTFVHDLLDVYWMEEHYKKYDKQHNEQDEEVTKKRKVDEQGEEDEEDDGDIVVGPEFYETEIRFTNMLMATTRRH